MVRQVRASINAITWTPEGRRCLTGTNAGEFTLWQGQHFGFETILQVCLQAHVQPPPMLVLQAAQRLAENS